MYPTDYTIEELHQAIVGKELLHLETMRCGIVTHILESYDMLVLWDTDSEMHDSYTDTYEDLTVQDCVCIAPLTTLLNLNEWSLL